MTGHEISFREVPGGFKIRWDQTLAERWSAQADWSNTNLGELARKLAESAPDDIMVIEAGTAYSNRDIFEESKKLASALLRRGLEQGSVISYQIPNWYEGCVINIAASLAGLVVNPLVPIYRDNEIRFMLDDVSAQVVFAPQIFRKFEYGNMFQRIKQEVKQPFELVILRGEVEGATSYKDFLEGGDAGDVMPAVDSDAPFVMMHTSGTTGRPKCVVHSHNSFLVQGESHVKEFSMGSDEVNLVATPISHIAGIIVANLTSVFGGGIVVLMDTWVPEEAVKLMIKHSATSCGGATPFLKGMLDAAKAANTHLPSMRRAGCGGAAVPPELIYSAHEWFPNVLTYRIYGCTELPTITAGTQNRDEIDYGATTDGRIKHNEIKIVDSVTGVEVPEGQDGEILVRGAAMMLGYLRPEDNDDAFDEQGYFKTGDLGKIVDGSYLIITGRKKDLIIRHGENLSPKEIEDALFKHANIEDVAIVGKPDVVTGEAVCAFIVTKDNRPMDLKDVAEHLIATGLAKQKIPQYIVMMDELPTSPQGKILKNILREQAKDISDLDSEMTAS